MRLENIKKQLNSFGPSHFYSEIEKASISTKILPKGRETFEDILEEFKSMVEGYNDEQDLFLFLNKWNANQWLFNHRLQDGNKRMFLIFNKVVNSAFEYKDIQ